MRFHRALGDEQPGRDGRSYFGGASETIAARTVFREIPNVLAINSIGNPSARYNLRISAQSSTETPLLSPRLG